MSKTHPYIRCTFVWLFVVLQLAVVPATYSLHIHCHHTRHDRHSQRDLVSAVVACFSGHHCHCSHHLSEPTPDSQSPSPDQPHDSESCPVCQAAFATSTAEFFIPRLAEVTTVSVLPLVHRATPWSAERYRSKSRGPPTTNPVC